jgi:hypothetical protein
MMCGVVSAAGTVVTQINSNVGLQIAYPKTDYVIQNTTTALHFHVYNSTLFALNNSRVTCKYHLYNQTNYHIMDGTMLPDSNAIDVYFNVNDTITQKVGVYPYIVWCNSSTEYGYVSSSFKVTEGGVEPREPSSIFAILALLPMLLAVIFIIGGVTMGEDHTAFKIFSYIMSLVMYYASMFFTLIVIKQFYVFSELTDGMITYLYLFTIVFVLIVTYFIIYLIIKATLAAGQAKDGRLQY